MKGGETEANSNGEWIPKMNLSQVSQGGKAMRRAANVIALCLIGSFVLAFPAGLCAEKPKEIIYAAIPDMTGPYAAIVGPAYAAFQDAAEYVNENGGIKGVPLKIEVRDCGGKVDVGVNIYMQYREMTPRPSMIYGVLSGVGEALKERMAEDKIPGMWVCSTEVIYPAKYMFGAYPTYADLCGTFIDWLAANKKGGSPVRVAFLTWDSTYGKAILYDEVRDYAKSKGVEIVAEELFSVRDVDLTSQLTRIRAKKADWIFTNTAGRGPVLVAKAAREMGLKARVAGSIGLDDSCLYIDREVFAGAVTVHPFANWSETNNKGIQLMNKYIEKNKRKPEYRTIMYPMGFTGVLVFKEVVERIVNKHGWDKVDGPNIKAEMEALQNFNPQDIGIFSYTSKRHSPNQARVFEVKGGKWAPVTKMMTCPDLRPAKYK
jgi:ABC-type branched-subunit amino acid transport system substrate-binding protein